MEYNIHMYIFTNVTADATKFYTLNHRQMTILIELNPPKLFVQLCIKGAMWKCLLYY